MARLRSLSAKQILAVKGVLFVVFLLPAAMIIINVQQSADPVEYITSETGEFALRLLVLTLCITPLQRISGWNWLIKLRRLCGLYAFFYALLHFSTYLFLDLGLNFSGVWDDILKRKYITVGFAAFVLLIPLAITSNDRLIRRLGAHRWGQLHKAVYLIAPLAVLHFFWQVRGEDWTEAGVYFALIAILLAMRVPLIAEKIKHRK